MKVVFRPIIISLYFSFVAHSTLVAQYPNKINLRSPLDIPLYISGNFGELRSNHLHTGIDFRTLGVTGKNVYAVENGFVSRIKIEPEGYGNAVYITHANGYISLYAHLDRFNDDIQKYCKNEQYKHKSFSIDIQVPPGILPVNKGDIIAWSGNSGSSMGPHLHFEMREKISQDPVNVFRLSSISIPDTIPPVIEKLWIYPLSPSSLVNNQPKSASYAVYSVKNESALKPDTLILVRGNIGLGIQTYDRTDTSNMHVGDYSIDLFLNDKLIFQQVMDKYSFSQTRFVNSLIDYGYYIQNKEHINRLFLQPNNQFSVYKQSINRGIINIADTSTKTVIIRIKDDNLNENTLTFKLKGDVSLTPINLPSTKSDAEYHPVYYQKDNLLQFEKIKLFIPKDALYDDMILEYSKLPQQTGYFSELHHVHNPYTPLHKSASLYIKPENLPSSLYSKALLLNIDEEGKIKWNGGSYKDGYVAANIRFFGTYVVGIDTVAPEIKLIGNGSRADKITFLIKDGLSGIKEYAGYIDGKWALFEYDYKQNQISYQFDPERMTFGKDHKLDLHVTDEKNNVSKYYTDFFK